MEVFKKEVREVSVRDARGETIVRTWVEEPTEWGEHQHKESKKGRQCSGWLPTWEREEDKGTEKEGKGPRGEVTAKATEEQERGEAEAMQTLVLVYLRMKKTTL